MATEAKAQRYLDYRGIQGARGGTPPVKECGQEALGGAGELVQLVGQPVTRLHSKKP